MNQNELNEMLTSHKLWLNGHQLGRRADFTKANLSHINLRGVDLTEAILYMTDLCGADLRGTHLFGANLVGANLHGALYNEHTTFPESVYGFDPIASGMILVEEKFSPAKQDEVVAGAVPAATTSTLHEELSAVLAKHGLVLGKNCIFSLI